MQRADKFVPAKPPDDTRLRDDGAQAVCRLDQHLVARLMAVRVIDRFETVEVDQKHRDLTTCQFAIFKHHAKGHVKGTSVQRSRQGIKPVGFLQLGKALCGFLLGFGQIGLH